MLGSALGQAAGGAAAGTCDAGWAPYPRTLAIDGAGGLALGFMAPDDPLVPAELAAARASGLSAIVLTLAPQGQFWMDDAALARTRANIDTWNAIIARHPDYLLAVRSSGDLARARAESKLGVIYTFQGAEPLGENVDLVSTYR